MIFPVFHSKTVPLTDLLAVVLLHQFWVQNFGAFVAKVGSRKAVASEFPIIIFFPSVFVLAGVHDGSAGDGVPRGPFQLVSFRVCSALTMLTRGQV